MALTDKQEKFAQAIADGKTQADAYRLAYDAGGTKAEVIHVKASQLMANGKVAVRVDALKSEIAAKLLWSREQSVEILSEIARDSEVKASEKVSAIKELNSMHGFNAPIKTELAVSFPREIHIVSGRA